MPVVNQNHIILANFQAAGTGILIDRSQRIAFSAYIDDSYRYVYADEVKTNQEYQVIGIYDNSSLKLFVNGVLTESLSINR